MVKKLKQLADRKEASSAPLFDGAIASAVRDSAHQIWLAGMGAFARAQQEGGKVFDALVKEGTSLQRKTQAAAEDKIGDVASRVSDMAGGVSAKAGQQWDRLESIFEERTAKALTKLGVPRAQDIDALTRRVDELSALVAKLSKAPARSATPSAPLRAAVAKKSVAAKTARVQSAPEPAAKRSPRTTTKPAAKSAIKPARAAAAPEAPAA